MKRFLHGFVDFLKLYLGIVLIVGSFVSISASISDGNFENTAVLIALSIGLIVGGIAMLRLYFKSELYQSTKRKRQARKQSKRAQKAPEKPAEPPKPAEPKEAICPECGKRYSLDHVYCEECGALLERK